MTKVGYMRVSTDRQDHALQFDALIRDGVSPDKIFKDTISGKTTTREGLDRCLSVLRAGDTLVVWKVDRLGRNPRHLYNIVGDLLERKVEIRGIEGAIDLQSVTGRAAFGMQAVFAEMERGFSCERVKAGIASKMAAGRKRWGRLPAVDYDEREVVRLLTDGLTHREVAAEIGISKATVQRIDARRLTPVTMSRNINLGVIT